MAPSFRPGKGRSPRGDEDSAEARVDRRTRKPLVEKKRRARINESLQELRSLLADSEFQAKLENAEVLELTVRRVQAVLERRSHEGGRLHHEASERFAAGYIQCMHEVHTFVSGCPGIDATTAAELLNHLLESMPLKEGIFPNFIADVLVDPSLGPSPGGKTLAPVAEPSLGALGLVLPTLELSPSTSEETCSDSEEAEAELGQTSTDGLEMCSLPSPTKSMWRPW